MYAGKFFTGQVELSGVRSDGTPVALPAVRTRPGGYRFLPDGTGLVYLPFIPSLDFWLIDFASETNRQLTHLSNQGALGTFDITPDGKAIVFDRTRTEFGCRSDRAGEVSARRRPSPSLPTGRRGGRDNTNHRSLADSGRSPISGSLGKPPLSACADQDFTLTEGISSWRPLTQERAHAFERLLALRSFHFVGEPSQRQRHDLPMV